MDATEAKTKATAIARAEAEKKSAALKKRREALKASVPRLRAERIKKIEADFRERIKWAVEGGRRSTEITLSEDHSDHLRGMYKYLPTRGKDGWYKAWGEGYLKYAPWGKYVKLVLTKLRRDGYTCEIEGKSVEHDTSSAYMNSGGECGSETPWWTRNTVLIIKW
jgi:hypothetical protein